MDLLRREPPPAHGTDAVATISVEEQFLEAARTGSFHQEAQSLSAQIQAAISSVVPRDRTVAVISKGDDELLAIEGRHGWHFPRTPDGTYAGYHPGSSDDAIQHLETLRTNGASYLVVPAPSMWWLDYYTEFTRYLLSKYRLVLYDPGSCVIFALDAAPSVGTDVQANLIRSARPGLQRVPSATSEKS
jgi:hypothetical protein